MSPSGTTRTYHLPSLMAAWGSRPDSRNLSRCRLYEVTPWSRDTASGCPAIAFRESLTHIFIFWSPGGRISELRFLGLPDSIAGHKRPSRSPHTLRPVLNNPISLCGRAVAEAPESLDALAGGALSVLSSIGRSYRLRWPFPWGRRPWPHGACRRAFLSWLADGRDRGPCASWPHNGAPRGPFPKPPASRAYRVGRSFR